MTISKAFVLLEEGGVLERRPGRSHVVPERRSGTVRATRFEHLEQALRPVATKARQLNLEPDTAVQVFRRLLEDDER
jgi:DNA-binding transcriptional regulator YhcF (GntR family)